MIDLEQLRRAYPNPTSISQDLFGSNYCVGGAICSRSQIFPESNYPPCTVLIIVLRELNNSLTLDDASYYAPKIIRANDAKLFDEAWLWAEKALTA